MTNKSNGTNNVDGDDNVMETRWTTQAQDNGDNNSQGKMQATEGATAVPDGGRSRRRRRKRSSGRTLIGICINLYERNRE